MDQSIMERLNTFADVCAETKRNEQDFAVPADANAFERFLIRTKRVWLIAKGYNGDEKVDMVNTGQWKHTPLYEIIPDEKAPSGFRLAFADCGCAYSYSYLGARPPFVYEEHAVDAGEKFLEEFTEWNRAIADAFGEL
jgi:hypothetical protein